MIQLQLMIVDAAQLMQLNRDAYHGADSRLNTA